MNEEHNTTEGIQSEQSGGDGAPVGVFVSSEDLSSSSPEKSPSRQQPQLRDPSMVGTVKRTVRNFKISILARRRAPERVALAKPVIARIKRKIDALTWRDNDTNEIIKEMRVSRSRILNLSNDTWHKDLENLLSQEEKFDALLIKKQSTIGWESLELQDDDDAIFGSSSSSIQNSENDEPETSEDTSPDASPSHTPRSNRSRTSSASEIYIEEESDVSMQEEETEKTDASISEQLKTTRLKSFEKPKILNLLFSENWDDFCQNLDSVTENLTLNDQKEILTTLRKRYVAQNIAATKTNMFFNFHVDGINERIEKIDVSLAAPAIANDLQIATPPTEEPAPLETPRIDTPDTTPTTTSAFTFRRGSDPVDTETISKAQISYKNLKLSTNFLTIALQAIKSVLSAVADFLKACISFQKKQSGLSQHSLTKPIN